MLNDYETFINVFIENIRKDVLLETNNNIDIKNPLDENFIKNRNKLIESYKNVFSENIDSIVRDFLKDKNIEELLDIIEYVKSPLYKIVP